MPIPLTCGTCGKKLQVGDQYAGRKVACPGCKTVLTAPGAPSAPASPGAALAAKAPAAPTPAAKAPAAASKPAAPLAAKAVVKPAAPPPVPASPPPVPEPEPELDDEFSFGSANKAKAKPAVENDEYEEPRAKKTADKGKAKKDAPKGKRRTDDDDDYDDDDSPKKRKRYDPTDPKPEKYPAKKWKSFAGGCSMAKWGTWLEFLAFAYGLGIIGYIAIGVIENPGGMLTNVNDAGGPALLAPAFVGTLLGTLLTMIGRTRIMNVPAGTGAKKVFFGAWAFTMIRFIAIVVSSGAIVMAATEWPDMTKPGVANSPQARDALLHTLIAFFAFLVSLPFWVLADLSTIPGMGIVGGCIPSARLLRKVGTVTFTLQALVFGYVIVVVAAGFAGKNMNFGAQATDTNLVFDPRTGNMIPRAGATSRMNSNEENAKSAVMVSVGLGILIQLVYAALFATMYGVGRYAVTEAVEAEENAEDEDV